MAANNNLWNKTKYFFPWINSSGAMRERAIPTKRPDNEIPATAILLNKLMFQFLFKALDESIPILFFNDRAAGVGVPAAVTFYADESLLHGVNDFKLCAKGLLSSHPIFPGDNYYFLRIESCKFICDIGGKRPLGRSVSK